MSLGVRVRTRLFGRGAEGMGEPEAAPVCRCDHPWPEDDHCLRCGRWLMLPRSLRVED